MYQGSGMLTKKLLSLALMAGLGTACRKAETPPAAPAEGADATIATASADAAAPPAPEADVAVTPTPPEPVVTATHEDWVIWFAQTDGFASLWLRDGAIIGAIPGLAHVAGERLVVVERAEGRAIRGSVCVCDVDGCRSGPEQDLRLPRFVAREPATGNVVEVLSEPTIEGPVRAGFFTRTDARIDANGRIVLHAETMLPESCTGAETRSVMASAVYDPANAQVVREVPTAHPSPAVTEAAAKLLGELGAKPEPALVWVGEHWTANPEKGLFRQLNFARDRIIGTLDAPVDAAAVVPEAIRKFFATPTEYARLRFGFAKASEKVAAANLAAFMPHAEVWKTVAVPVVQGRVPADGGWVVRAEPAPVEGPLGPKDAVVTALVDLKDGAHVVVIVGEQVVTLRLEGLGALAGAAMAHVDADDDADFELLVTSTDGHAVIDFDGAAMKRLDAASAALAGAKDLTEALERVQRHRHADRLARGIFPGPCTTTTGDYTRTFRWDEAGRALGEKAPDVEFQLLRDAAGRLVGRRIIGASQTQESRIVVDARGLEIAEQAISPDETGRVPVGMTLTSHDARGRIVRRMFVSPDGIVTETFAWDGQRLVASDHDAPDAHEHCVDTPPTAHEEDAAGRVIRQEFRNMPGLCESDRIVTWKRDAAGNVLVERYEPLGVDAGPVVETRYDYACWSK